MNSKMDRMAIVKRVFSNILEQHMFIFDDGMDETPDFPEIIDDYAVVSMKFSGDINGEFKVFIPVAVCAEITANVMGLDVEDERVQATVIDGTKEMLNIIGANVLSELLGDGHPFNISYPDFSLIDCKIKQSYLENIYILQEVVTLFVEGKPLLIQMSLNE